MTEHEPAHTGGDALVDALEVHGVDAAFGVVSVHNLPLVDAVDRRLRWVPTRGEAGAVNAADAYGRVRDGLGCAVTSTGTGAGNAAGALIESLTAGSAVLHVTGQIDSEHLDLGRGVIHETRDQLGMLRSVSKAAARAAGADPIAEGAALALAFPRGPVSIEWPIDLQYSPTDGRADGGAASSRSSFDQASMPIDGISGDVDRAATLARASERALVWVGGGARWSREEVVRLAEGLGAGILTSNAGRGVVAEDHPLVIGNFAAHPSCAPLLESADLLVSIGTHFRSNETRSFRLPLPRPHIQIDVDEAALGRSYAVDVGIAGSASAALVALCDAIGVRGAVERSREDGLGPFLAEDPWGRQIARARRDVRAAVRADIGPYGEVCDALRAAVDRRSPLVRDITIPNSAWGNRLLDVYDPADNIYPKGGGIGQALAMTVGAGVGRRDVPTLTIIGDGGFQVQEGELATLAQERVHCLVVVFDDGGYGVLRNTQDAHVGRRSGVDLFTPDFGALATAHDLPWESVGSASDVGAAAGRLLAAGGPALLHIDCDALGPMPKPFTPPVSVPSANRRGGSP